MNLVAMFKCHVINTWLVEFIVYATCRLLTTARWNPSNQNIFSIEKLRRDIQQFDVGRRDFRCVQVIYITSIHTNARFIVRFCYKIASGLYLNVVYMGILVLYVEIVKV